MSCKSSHPSRGAPSILLSRANCVATLTIHNPPLNILSMALRRDLLQRVRELDRDRDVRIVVIRGSGDRAFSVGSDLKEFPHDEAGGRQKIQFEQYLLEAVEHLPQITLAVLQGYVLGGGAELMLACDLRIAVEGTKIGFPEVKVGGFPAAGGAQRLTRDIGPVRAKEMLLFGEPVSASEAQAIGLITEMVAGDELEPRVQQRVERLLSLPQSSLAGIKRSVGAAVHGMISAQGQAIEADEFGRLFLGRDIFEGIAAFREKRPPQFNKDGNQ